MRGGSDEGVASTGGQQFFAIYLQMKMFS